MLKLRSKGATYAIPNKFDKERNLFCLFELVQYFIKRIVQYVLIQIMAQKDRIYSLHADDEGIVFGTSKRTYQGSLQSESLQ